MVCLSLGRTGDTGASVTGADKANRSIDINLDDIGEHRRIEGSGCFVPYGISVHLMKHNTKRGGQWWPPSDYILYRLGARLSARSF